MDNLHFSEYDRFVLDRNPLERYETASQKNEPEIRANMTAREMADAMSRRLIEAVKEQLEKNKTL